MSPPAGDAARRAASGIFGYFIQHRTVANLLLVVLVGLGLMAVPKMRAQFFPDVIIDSVSVGVAWPGAGPEDVDGAVVQLLEPALLAVEDIESVSSVSTQGYASIRLDFVDGTDISRATDEVKTAVDGVTGLPEDTDPPTVRRRAWRDRVTDVVITGPVSVDQLARFADEFVNKLFEKGVTKAIVRGVAPTETTVTVPESALIQNNTTLQEIASVIGQEASADPVGEFANGSQRVRSGVEKRTAAEIADIVVKTEPNGSKIRVGDLGAITVAGVDRSRAYFVGENPAISLRVDRGAKGDAIEIQRRVEEAAQETLETLPAGVNIELIRTRSEAITGRLNILLSSGAIGLGLVLMLLFVFLNARTAFWVAAGIPVVMCGAIAIMSQLGVTINMVSLFALIITLGIVVDDAIVVGEHADFRLRRLGEDPAAAAENAARRMFTLVFAATLTTVIAFGGLVLIGGRFGNLIRDLPITVIIVLLVSLVECFLILPCHMRHSLAHVNKVHWYNWPSRTFNRGFQHARERWFRPLMAWVIRLRYPVLAATLLALASQIALFASDKVRWRFFNAPELGSVSGNFAMVPGATSEDTMAMMRELQRATEELGKKYEGEYGRNPLDFVMAQVGGTTGRGLAGSETLDSSLLGSISIELIDADLRPYSSFKFVGELQESVRRHPLLSEVSFRGWRFGPGGDSLNAQFYGSEAKALKAAAEALKAAVAPFPEVSAVQDNLAYGKEEKTLDLTPQGERLGFTIDQISRTLRHRLGGIEAASYPEGTRSAKIRVGLPHEELSADFLERTRLRSRDGNYTPLLDIVSVTTREGFASVRRENGVRLVEVTGDISEDDPERADEIVRLLETEILPEIAQTHKVSWKLAGLAEQEDSFLSDALIGLFACLTGIYLTLAWVFSSWTRPIVIMAVIPFGLVGVIYGHYVWGVPLSMFSVLGLIGMTGIIINDSIVLVSTIDEHARDRPLPQAIVDGAVDRLRPVLLTTLTTVLGLTPLLYVQSQHAQFLKPTVITLCYGLGFGMVLVLLVIPSLLGMQRDFARFRSSLGRSWSLRPSARPVFAACAAACSGGFAAFAMTLGPAILLGELPAFTRSFLGLGEGAGVWTAFGLFAAGLALSCLCSYALGAYLLRRRARLSAPAPG